MIKKSFAEPTLFFHLCPVNNVVNFLWYRCHEQSSVPRIKVQQQAAYSAEWHFWWCLYCEQNGFVL